MKTVVYFISLLFPLFLSLTPNTQLNIHVDTQETVPLTLTTGLSSFVTHCSGDYTPSLALNGNELEINPTKMMYPHRVSTGFVYTVGSASGDQYNYTLTVVSAGNASIDCSLLFFVSQEKIVVPADLDKEFLLSLNPPAWSFINIETPSNSMVSIVVYYDQTDVDLNLAYSIAPNAYPTFLDSYSPASVDVIHGVAKYEVAYVTDDVTQNLYFALFEDSLFPAISDVSVNCIVSINEVVSLLDGSISDPITFYEGESRYFTVFGDENSGLYIEVIYTVNSSVSLIGSYDAPTPSNKLDITKLETIELANGKSKNIYYIQNVESQLIYLRVSNAGTQELTFTMNSRSITAYDISLDETEVVNHNPGKIDLFSIKEVSPEIMHLFIKSDNDLNLFISQTSRIPTIEHHDNSISIHSDTINGKFVKSVILPNGINRNPWYLSISNRYDDGVGLYEITVSPSTYLDIGEFNQYGGIVKYETYDFFKLNAFEDFPYVLYFTVESTFGSLNAMIQKDGFPSANSHITENFEYRTVETEWNPSRFLGEGVITNLNNATYNMRLSQRNNITDAPVQYQMDAYLVVEETVSVAPDWTDIVLSSRKISFIRLSTPDHIGKDLYLWISNPEDFIVYMNPGGYARQTQQQHELEIVEYNNTKSIKFTPKSDIWYATIVAKEFETNVEVSIREEGLIPSNDPQPTTDNSVITIPIWLAAVFIGSFAMVIVILIIVLACISSKPDPNAYELVKP